MATTSRSNRYRILVVDDEEIARQGLKQILRRHDVAVDLAPGGEEAVEMIFSGGCEYHVVLTDFSMPRMNGKQLLERIVRDRPLTRVIIVTGRGSTSTAVECMKAGAHDFIEKPYDVTLIRAAVDRAIRECKLCEDNLTLRRSMSAKGSTEPSFVWADPAMDRVVMLAQRVALTEDPVLIQGESGVGKELVARLIHESSRLKDRQFLAINCGALPEDLLVSELFGYEKGAFTGADSTKAGLFEATGGGTLFLDEIGDLPLSMQARFLRVLEQKEVIRVGGRAPVPVEFRLVAATNRDLEQMACATPATFRADLYYRLRVHLVTIPPLRERPADIPLLLDHFVRVLEREGQTPVRGFSAQSMEVLTRYGWPGNIRELASLVRQVGVVASGRTVEVGDLPSPSRSRESTGPVHPDSSAATRPNGDGPESLDQLKLDHIRQVLERTEGNRTQSARLLGMSRVTLQRFLARHPELSRVGKGEPDQGSG